MRALITGISGQDGSYLAELLLSKGYEVHGIVRRSSTLAGLWRIKNILDKITMYYGDVTEGDCMSRLVREIKPSEVYHLAAQSHVAVSFEQPAYTVSSILGGTINMLEAVRCFAPEARYYQASSSEMFGASPPPQNEETPFLPRSPYACAKVAAYWAVRNYRDGYGMHASNGILFNHESPRRGEAFVTRKITLAAAGIKLGLQKELVLGDVDTSRDFGYAVDYVWAIWLMLQMDKPNDYVIATGESYTIREFLERAFDCLDLRYSDYVVFNDARYLRPLNVPALQGDASKARRILNWKPTVEFDSLVKMMIYVDFESARHETNSYRKVAHA